MSEGGWGGNRKTKTNKKKLTQNSYSLPFFIFCFTAVFLVICTTVSPTNLTGLYRHAHTHTFTFCFADEWHIDLIISLKLSSTH